MRFGAPDWIRTSGLCLRREGDGTDLTRLLRFTAVANAERAVNGERTGVVCTGVAPGRSVGLRVAV